MTSEEAQTIVRVMIIDDDCINNTICKHLIKKVLPEVDIKPFTEARMALKFIEEEYTAAFKGDYTLILLDINMPVMSGWDFLEEFGNIDTEIQRQFTITLLSSSVDARDKLRAESSPLISNFISKPLTTAGLKEIAMDRKLL